MKEGEIKEENKLVEKATFDVESRDKVREHFFAIKADIELMIDASLLREKTKKEMKDFFQKFLNELEDDGIVERGWVTFNSKGDIVRARSENGVYDLRNTCRYFLEEMGGQFFSSLSVAFLNESHKEMREVRLAIEAIMCVS